MQAGQPMLCAVMSVRVLHVGIQNSSPPSRLRHPSHFQPNIFLIILTIQDDRWCANRVLPNRAIPPPPIMAGRKCKLAHEKLSSHLFQWFKW